MSKEYLIVLPVDPLNLFILGKEYASGEPLPPHCTVMPWFTLKNDHDYKLFSRELDAYASILRQVELISQEPAQFGPNNDIPVHVLEDTYELRLLHDRIFYLLAGCAVFHNLQWVNVNWRPHVTDGEYVFLPGERYSPKQLVGIERTNEGGRMVRTIWE